MLKAQNRSARCQEFQCREIPLQMQWHVQNVTLVESYRHICAVGLEERNILGGNCDVFGYCSQTQAKVYSCCLIHMNRHSRDSPCKARSLSPDVVPARQ